MQSYFRVRMGNSCILMPVHQTHHPSAHHLIPRDRSTTRGQPFCGIGDRLKSGDAEAASHIGHQRVQMQTS